MPSRESLKAFCRYAAENIRHIFLAQQGLGGLAGASGASDGMTAEETDRKVTAYAGSLSKTFPRRASEVLDRTLSLIDRNVNQKLAVTDMVDRLYRLL